MRLSGLWIAVSLMCHLVSIRTVKLNVRCTSRPLPHLSRDTLAHRISLPLELRVHGTIHCTCDVVVGFVVRFLVPCLVLPLPAFVLVIGSLLTFVQVHNTCRNMPPTGMSSDIYNCVPSFTSQIIWHVSLAPVSVSSAARVVQGRPDRS